MKMRIPPKAILFQLLTLIILTKSKAQCPPTFLTNVTFSPVKNKYCLGDVITITFNTNDVIVNLDWDFNGTPATTQSSPSNVFVINGILKNGNLTIDGNTIDPITGTPCLFSISQLINITDLTADAGNSVIMQPLQTSVIIGGAPTANLGTSPYNYAWSPNININSTTASNPIVNPSTNTNYLLTVTDADQCTAASNVMVYTTSSITNNKNYAILKKTLDAGYYESVNYLGNNILYFKFDEEYNVPSSTNLTYNIYNDSGVLISPPQSLIKTIGDNRFSLNVATLASGSFYKLYVYNQKNEVWQTRIKIN